MVLVHKDSYLMTKDINLDQATDAPIMDGLVNRCYYSRTVWYLRHRRPDTQCKF